ncbi:MAG: thymidine phosphorylase [Calditrichaeota bacterium]|nr:MAG: thymidine phosphorylase [Calditrichota bacterium]
MTPYEIIAKKRDGHTCSPEEINWLINAYTEGALPDYQMAAWLMAAFIRGLNDEEKHAITRAMLHSGIVADLSDIPGIKVDKHSTGGVGDKVSIILAPVVAAAGVPVPMISGRGLGHTGGTLDKLESIPGFKTDYDFENYRRIIRETGVCLIGQTKEIAPADKKIYALRDVTATVESIPLISASIMSKKLAEGIDALVLDVKCGSGAFMKEPERAEELARSLIGIGEAAGKTTVAYMTNMDEPLGRKVGNWLEIEECIDALNGNGPADLMEVTHHLCGAMIWLGGKARDAEEGRAISREMIHSGKAMKKFLEIVEAQQGNTEFIRHPERYPKARYQREVTATATGWVNAIDTMQIGIAGVELGAGRLKQEDTLDMKAGLIIHKKIGDKVQSGEKLATLLADNEARLDKAAPRVQNAYTIRDETVEPPTLILKYLDKNT